MREEQVAKQLGRNLWRARRRADLSQEKLAALCSLHRTEIGLLENGRRFPRVDTLIKLAFALDVGAEELLRGIVWTLPAPQREGSLSVETPLRGVGGYARQ
ncbi:MAG TPA: helix-turn-helix transcriptional regulator [Solirubrobacterales bacterium]|nr:helix-turn-helix transcriptional regulator [Solirubrobacterales bacterium]